MTAPVTDIRTAKQIVIDGETFELYPMDHGGWVATYKDLVLAATDGQWIPADSVNWATDEGEDEVRWPTRKAAVARIRETCQIN